MYLSARGETMTEERPATEAEEQTDAPAATDEPEPEAEPEAERADASAEPEAKTEAAAADERPGDIVEQAATPKPVEPDGSRGRRVLAAVFWLAASIMVLFGGVVVWAHQTLLTADGWGGIVEDVISEEEVTEAISVVLVDRLAESLEIREAVASAIPGPDIIGGAVTAVVQDRVTDLVADFAQSDGFQEAFVNVNKAAHDAAMVAIRGGDGDALTSGEGVLALNIFPLIEGVLISLQDAGLIDEGREIPDLTGFEASDRAVVLIEQVLGRDIPDDVGTIVLLDSENLELIQTIVRWFDAITILALLLWVLFTGLALWLARKRVRMTLWLAGGAIAALLTARVATRLLLETATRRQPELEARVVVSSIIDAAVDSLLLWTFALILLAGIVAVAAIVYERRDQLQRPSMETPPRTLGRWVKRNATVILVLGLGLIAVLAVWSIGGPGIAMLTAAAIMLLFIGVKVLADQADDASGSATEG
jgi:hypothetical protein